MSREMEERLMRGIERPAHSSSNLDDYTNLYLASVSPDNPLFLITSRQPAHVACLESPQAVCDWLLDRLTRFAGDPAAALDFEIVDLVRS